MKSDEENYTKNIKMIEEMIRIISNNIFLLAIRFLIDHCFMELFFLFYIYDISSITQATCGFERKYHM